MSELFQINKISIWRSKGNQRDPAGYSVDTSFGVRDALASKIPVPGHDPWFQTGDDALPGRGI